MANLVHPPLNRNNNVDFAKGVLIMLVFVGHAIKGGINDVFGRYMIYFFHMPLFISVSGYLFNTIKIKELSLIGVIKKYFFRVLLPWIIAVVFYAFIAFFFKHPKLPLGKYLLHSFIEPYYHLWFVLGFFTWVLITWFFLKVKLKINHLLILALVISIGAYALDHGFTKFKYTAALSIIDDDTRLYFYVFFVLGTWLKERLANIDKHVIKLLAVIEVVVLIAIIWLFYNYNEALKFILFYIFNFILVTLMLYSIKNELLPKFPFIEKLGKYSLSFYLWHVFPILLATTFFKENITYILGLLALEAVLMVIIYLSFRIPFVYKYIHGNI
jgi:peptidoglycan/LPS O-acetylase OafA/YrhL